MRGGVDLFHCSFDALQCVDDGEEQAASHCKGKARVSEGFISLGNCVSPVFKALRIFKMFI